jgi:hypothetical protein
MPSSFLSALRNYWEFVRGLMFTSSREEAQEIIQLLGRIKQAFEHNLARIEANERIRGLQLQQEIAINERAVQAGMPLPAAEPVAAEPPPAARWPVRRMDPPRQRLRLLPTADEWVEKAEKPARVVKRADLTRLCDDDCGICLEKHAKNEMIACGCTHEFGRACFLKVVETNVPSRIPVLCPLCRVPVKAFRGFRERTAARTNA